MSRTTHKKSAKVGRKATAKRVSAKANRPRKSIGESSTRKPTNATAKGSARTITHKDGSIYAKGRMLGGKMHGYWEFFRKDGTIMRSGSFDREQPLGTWTTYDAAGKIVKVTELNTGAKAKPRTRKAQPRAKNPKAVKLLSGGNPQIAKADGDAPVQDYIAAMPGWKRDVGRRLDAIIGRTVPDVRKAMRWNSPLYGMADQGWFLSLHCFPTYIKVAFFRGASLRPLPPGKSKQKDVRYLDIHEGDSLDEAQLAAWVDQARQLPGWGGA